MEFSYIQNNVNKHKRFSSVAYYVPVAYLRNSQL